MFLAFEDRVAEAHAFDCELLLHFSDLVSKAFQIIPTALHSIDLVGKDAGVGDFCQCAQVVQTFQRLGQRKIESGVLCKEAHIIVVCLYSFDRCCWSEMDGPVMNGLILTLGPYKVSIPICFLIADIGEHNQSMLAIIVTKIQ